MRVKIRGQSSLGPQQGFGEVEIHGKDSCISPGRCPVKDLVAIKMVWIISL